MNKILLNFTWAGLSTLVSKALLFGFDFLIVYYYAPSELKELIYVISLIYLFESISDFGFTNVLIQKGKEYGLYIKKVWYLEIFRCLFVGFILLIFSRYLIQYLDINDDKLLKAAGILIIVRSFRTLNYILLRIKLNFKKLFILEVIPNLLLVFAFLSFNYIFKNPTYIILLSLLAKRIFEVYISYILEPITYQKANWNILKSCLNYILWFTLLNLFSSCNRYIVTIVAPILFGLDLYVLLNRAEFFTVLITITITEVIWKFIYPTLTKLNHEDQKKLMSKIFKIYYISFLPYFLFLKYFSYIIIYYIIDSNWRGAIKYTDYFALFSTLIIYSSICSIILTANGKVKHLFINNVIASVISLIICYMLFDYFKELTLILYVYLLSAFALLLNNKILYEMFNFSVKFALFINILLSLGVILLKNTRI
jgi:O-antigen/teichoic acid export membrane protein